MGWVYVENDVTKYLPEESETRLGITAMNENFASFGTARVMVSSITYETAEKIYEQFKRIGLHRPVHEQYRVIVVIQTESIALDNLYIAVSRCPRLGN